MTNYYDLIDVEHISYFSRLVDDVDTVCELLLANTGIMSHRARLGIYMSAEHFIEKNALAFLEKFADRETTTIGNDTVEVDVDPDPATGLNGGTINGIRYLLTNPYCEDGKMALDDGRVLERVKAHTPDILFGHNRVYSRMQITPDLFFINGFLFGSLKDALEKTDILGKIEPL